MADGRVTVRCDKCTSPMAWTGPLCDKLTCNQCKQADALRIQKQRAELCERIINWWKRRPTNFEASMYAFAAEFQAIK